MNMGIPITTYNLPAWPLKVEWTKESEFAFSGEELPEIEEFAIMTTYDKKILIGMCLTSEDGKIICRRGSIMDEVFKLPETCTIQQANGGDLLALDGIVGHGDPWYSIDAEEALVNMAAKEIQKKYDRLALEYCNLLKRNSKIEDTWINYEEVPDGKRYYLPCGIELIGDSYPLIRKVKKKKAIFTMKKDKNFQNLPGYNLVDRHGAVIYEVNTIEQYYEELQEPCKTQEEGFKDSLDTLRYNIVKATKLPEKYLGITPEKQKFIISEMRDVEYTEIASRFFPSDITFHLRSLENGQSINYIKPVTGL